MAKLFLKFDQAILKEVPLSQSAVTIGRLPDNIVQIDNLAVSGHHARIYWEANVYFVEDLNSLNGTYVNDVRITKRALRDGDSVLIGKHTIAFKAEAGSPAPGPRPAQVEQTAPAVPKLDRTMMLDTKKMKEMLAGMHPPGHGQTPPPTAAPVQAAGEGSTAGHAPTQRYSMPVPPVERVGMLNVVSGKTDQTHYLLTSKMSVIGKSDMASIKLKGWFAPKMAAIISKRDTAYVIAASEKKIKVKVNGEEVIGQKPLAENDVIEVAGVKMTFGLQE